MKPTDQPYLVAMKTLCLIVRTTLLTLLVPFALRADDVTDAIEEASASYKAGDFESSAGMLEYAAGLVRQMRGGKLQDLLPAVPEGWESPGASSETMGAAMFGGGTTVSQRYEKGQKSVSITIVGDSPLLQSMGMMFNNPAMAASAGMRFKRVNDQKVLLEFDEDETSGEITAFVASKWLVTINGEGVSQDELLEWAGRIDFKRLGEF